MSIPDNMSLFHWGIWRSPLRSIPDIIGKQKITVLSAKSPVAHVHCWWSRKDGGGKEEKNPLILKLGNSGPIRSDPRWGWPKFFNPMCLRVLICQRSIKVPTLQGCWKWERQSTPAASELPTKIGSHRWYHHAAIPGPSLHTLFLLIRVFSLTLCAQSCLSKTLHFDQSTYILPTALLVHSYSKPGPRTNNTVLTCEKHRISDPSQNWWVWICSATHFWWCLHILKFEKHCSVLLFPCNYHL